VVIALAAVAAWLMRRNADEMRRHIEAGNQELRKQLTTSEGRAQMLADENVNLKTRNAAIDQQATLQLQRIDELLQDVEKLRSEIKELDEAKDALDREKAALATKLESVTRTREQLEQDSRQAFKIVAGELLDLSRKAMNEEGKESLSQLLAPLREQITGLNKDLKDYQQKQDINSQIFDKEIKKMQDANRQISQEATRLSNALISNNKIQGDWGEGVLKRILDLSGLQENVHYQKQVTRDDDDHVITNDEGAMLRPDFTLFMPDGKRLIIDSKVSLTAFVGYVNATDPDEQQRLLNEHKASVRNQIDLLAKKDYVKHVKNSVDFALMFIPNEPAYLAAMQGNQDLWEYAYSKRVVVVSPTHLLSVAQLLMQLWSRDKQNKNAEAIAKEVMKLIDKLDTFYSDLDKIQNGINAMQTTFDNAKKKLEGKGGVFSKGEKIKQLAGLKNAEIEQ
jgi:DNA recombination protein RmuC